MHLQKSQIIPVLTTLMLVLGLGSLINSASAQPMKTTRHSERHPELRAALRDLQKARAELQEGAHDFKGERVEAIKDTDKAIAEVQQALKADKY